MFSMFCMLTYDKSFCNIGQWYKVLRIICRCFHNVNKWLLSLISKYVKCIYVKYISSSANNVWRDTWGLPQPVKAVIVAIWPVLCQCDLNSKQMLGLINFTFNKTLSKKEMRDFRIRILQLRSCQIESIAGQTL